MRPVLPIHLPDVDQTDICLVHERRGLETVTNALPSHAALRDPMKLPFDHGDEARQRLFVAPPPRQEQARYIAKRSRNAHILRVFPPFLRFRRISRLRARVGRRNGPDARSHPSSARLFFDHDPRHTGASGTCDSASALREPAAFRRHRSREQRGRQPSVV